MELGGRSRFTPMSRERSHGTWRSAAVHAYVPREVTWNLEVGRGSRLCPESGHMELGGRPRFTPMSREPSPQTFLIFLLRSLAFTVNPVFKVAPVIKVAALLFNLFLGPDFINSPQGKICN